MVDQQSKFVKREWNSPSDHNNGDIKVMTWNILADKLADSFDRVPKEYLTWEHRFPLMVEHIQTQAPHIVCLQEVDRFDDIMAALTDYDGKCVMKEGGVIMGVAILWKKDSIDLTSTEGKIESGAFL